MLDELFQWREITVTRRRVLEMGHLRENKQEFWRRKSNITPKNPKQSWFSYKSTTTFFAQPHGIGKKQGVRCTGLYRSSQSQHACTHYRYSWIREHSTALHSRIFTLNHNLNVHIYINTREKTTNMHHSLFIQKDQLSLRVPMNTPTQLLSHVGERTINTAIILSKVPESQLHYYLHRLISLG